jgi:hypothetical protein
MFVLCSTPKYVRELRETQADGPIWNRSDHSIRIVCSCGRPALEERLGIFATLRRLDTQIRLGDLI